MCVAVHTGSEPWAAAAATRTALSAALLLVSYTTLAKSMGLCPCCSRLLSDLRTSTEKGRCLTWSLRAALVLFLRYRRPLHATTKSRLAGLGARARSRSRFSRQNMPTAGSSTRGARGPLIHRPRSRPCRASARRRRRKDSSRAARESEYGEGWRVSRARWWCSRKTEPWRPARSLAEYVQKKQNMRVKIACCFRSSRRRQEPSGAPIYEDRRWGGATKSTRSRSSPP